MKQFRHIGMKEIAEVFDAHNVNYKMITCNNEEEMIVPVNVSQCLFTSIGCFCLRDSGEIVLCAHVMELDSNVSDRISRVTEACRVINKITGEYAEFIVDDMTVWAARSFENTDLDNSSVGESVYEYYLLMKNAITKYIPILLRLITADADTGQCFDENDSDTDRICAGFEEENNIEARDCVTQEAYSAITRIFEEFSEFDSIGDV